MEALFNILTLIALIVPVVSICLVLFDSSNDKYRKFLLGSMIYFSVIFFLAFLAANYRLYPDAPFNWLTFGLSLLTHCFMGYYFTNWYLHLFDLIMYKTQKNAWFGIIVNILLFVVFLFIIFTFCLMSGQGVRVVSEQWSH